MIELTDINYPQVELRRESFENLVKRALSPDRKNNQTNIARYQEAEKEREANNFWGTSTKEHDGARENKSRFMVGTCFPVAKLNSSFGNANHIEGKDAHKVAQVIETLSRNVSKRIISFIDSIIQTNIDDRSSFNLTTVDDIGVAYSESDGLKHYQIREGSFEFNIDLDQEGNIKTEQKEAKVKYYYQGNINEDDANARVEIKFAGSEQPNFEQELKPSSRTFVRPGFSLETTESRSTAKRTAKERPTATAELDKNFAEFISDLSSIQNGEAVDLVETFIKSIRGSKLKVGSFKIDSHFPYASFQLYDLKSLVENIMLKFTKGNYDQAADQNTEATVKSKALALMALLEIISKRDGQLSNSKINLKRTNNFSFKIPASDDEWLELKYKTYNGKRTYTLNHHLNADQTQTLTIKRNDDDNLIGSAIELQEEYKEKSDSTGPLRLKAKIEYQGNVNGEGVLSARLSNPRKDKEINFSRIMVS